MSKRASPNESKPARRAVVLVSGGLDSAVTLAQAVHSGFECQALTVDYGQRHRVEIEAARRVATALGAVEHCVVAVDLRAVGGSALTDPAIPVPKTTIAGAPATPASGIPITYVPARNTLFLAIALGYAETIGSYDLFIGVNAVDYSGYPDCRPEFISAFENLARYATRAGIEGGQFRFHTPLIHLTKARIIRLGLELGVDFSLTHSCYDPGRRGLACGRCESCVIRRRGFEEAGVPDPTRYAKSTTRR